MCDKELIVAYLYDEVPAAERAAVDAHLSMCAECRIELEELRSTRKHLALWAPPEPDLGFRLIRGGAEPAPPLPWRKRFVPAFGLAAAAVLVLAAATAIANIEVRYASDGLTVRTGWARQQVSEVPGGQQGAGQIATIAAGVDSAAQPVVGSEEFAALKQRLTDLESALAAGAGAPGVQAVSASRMSDAEMLREVRRIVNDAERRQQTAVARQLIQLFNDVDTRRRADIAQIQQGLGDYQGLTNAEIAQTRQRLNQLILAATRQEK